MLKVPSQILLSRKQRKAPNYAAKFAPLFCIYFQSPPSFVTITRHEQRSCIVQLFSCTSGNAPASLYRLISVDVDTFCLALPAAHLRAAMFTYVYYFFKGILSCRKTMHATCGRQLCNLLGPAACSRFAVACIPASFCHFVIALPMSARGLNYTGRFTKP